MLLVMTTPRSKKANRANAQKSTGPRTAAGKARSSKNALKHGLLSNEVLIAAGDSEEDVTILEALQDQINADLAPVGALQQMLAERVVSLIWRLRRLLCYEVGVTRMAADNIVADSYEQELTNYKIRSGGLPFKRPLSPELTPPAPTDDLRFEVESAERDVEAVEPCDPLASPSPGLGWALTRVAEALGVQLDPDLGLEYPGAIDRLTRDQLRSVFEAIRRRDETVEACWDRVRAAMQELADVHRRRLDHRLMKEDRAGKAVLLPSEAEVNKIMRYEAFISRELDRILRQLRELKS